MTQENYAAKTKTDWNAVANEAWDTVAEGVKKLRNEKRMSLQELSDMLGLKSPAHVAEWTRKDNPRRAPNAPFPNMLRYLDILGCKPHFSFSKSDAEVQFATKIEESKEHTDAERIEMLQKKIESLTQDVQELSLKLLEANKTIASTRVESSYAMSVNKNLLRELMRLNDIIMECRPDEASSVKSFFQPS